MIELILAALILIIILAMIFGRLDLIYGIVLIVVVVVVAVLFGDVNINK